MPQGSRELAPQKAATLEVEASVTRRVGLSHLQKYDCLACGGGGIARLFSEDVVL